jgi:drug/metabolite transporter (DMT)-like permease
MLVYLALAKAATGAPWPQLSVMFAIHCVLTALTQMAATAALLQLYGYRNFAVVNQLGKSDMIFTAVIGTVLFSQHLGPVSWAALAITGLGVAVIMAARQDQTLAQSWTLAGAWRSPAVRGGLFVGLMFGICNLTLREAALALGSPSAVLAGAITVATVTAIQTVIIGALVGLREPGAYRAIGANWPLAGFVGVTSALGSIAWFTAFALENAAHVRIAGQIEVVFTLLISAFYFRERVSAQEGLGIALTVAGIILVQVAG